MRKDAVTICIDEKGKAEKCFMRCACLDKSGWMIREKKTSLSLRTPTIKNVDNNGAMGNIYRSDRKMMMQRSRIRSTDEIIEIIVRDLFVLYATIKPMSTMGNVVIEIINQL